MHMIRATLFLPWLSLRPFTWTEASGISSHRTGLTPPRVTKSALWWWGGGRQFSRARGSAPANTVGAMAVPHPSPPTNIWLSGRNAILPTAAQPAASPAAKRIVNRQWLLHLVAPGAPALKLSVSHSYSIAVINLIKWMYFFGGRQSQCTLGIYWPLGAHLPRLANISTSWMAVWPRQWPHLNANLQKQWHSDGQKGGGHREHLALTSNLATYTPKKLGPFIKLGI